MRRVLLIAVLALQACGDSGETVAPVENRPAPETGATAAVTRLDEAARNGVLERAIRASGLVCPEVVKSERIEVSKGVMGWRAECDNGGAHLIQVMADGTAKVTSRTH